MRAVRELIGKSMDEEKFIEAYYTTRKNKRRSADSVEFELHWERNLVRLMNGLEDHTFTPSAYTFIAKRPRPREVFACEMALRVVHHYIDMRIRPLLESEMTERTFNNRIGYGGVEALNCVISDIYDVSCGFTKDAWIIKIDLKGYFPNASQDIVFRQLSNLVERRYEGEDKDLLQFMIMRSVFSYPTRHCYRKSALEKWKDIPDSKSLFKKPDGIGGAIGHLIWQNAMNYYLNDIDHWLVDKGLSIRNVSYPFSEMTPEVIDKFRMGCGLHYVRFVDDMIIVTDNKESTLALIQEIRKRLAVLGCELHDKKFYCQHYTKGVDFIGTHIKLDRVYVNSRNIRNMREAIHQFNRCVSVKKLETFLASMNSYLGILKGRNAYGIMRNLLKEVSPKWMKYCHFNEERRCFQANEGYAHTQLIANKYNLKFKSKHHDNKRTNLNAGVATA